MKRLMLVALAGVVMAASSADAKSKLQKAFTVKKKPAAKSSTVLHDSIPSATVTQAPAPPPPSTTMLDNENGFRGVPFGADQSSSYFFGAVLINASSDFTLMSRPSDPQTVGNVRINRILWLFYQHRLEAVMFDTIGPENGATLRQEFTASYGKPANDLASPTIDRQRWTGRVAELTESVHRDLGTVNVVISSLAIRAQAAASRKPPAK